MSGNFRKIKSVIIETSDLPKLDKTSLNVRSRLLSRVPGIEAVDVKRSTKISLYFDTLIRRTQTLQLPLYIPEPSRLDFLRKKKFKYNKRITYVEDIEHPTVFQRKCAFTSDPFWYIFMRGIIVLIILFMAISPINFFSSNLLGCINLSLHITYVIDFVMSFLMQHLVQTRVNVPNPVAKPVWVFIIDFIAIFPVTYIMSTPDNTALQVFIRCKSCLLIVRLFYEFLYDGLRLEAPIKWRVIELIVLTVCLRISSSLLVFTINGIDTSKSDEVDWMEFKNTLCKTPEVFSVIQMELPIICTTFLLNQWLYIPAICLIMFTYILNNTAKYSYMSHVKSFQTMISSRYGISRENATQVLEYLKMTWDTRADFMFMEAAVADNIYCNTTFIAMHYDRNLYALQHCPMLRDLGYHVLRFLAQMITPKMYLKGVDLYKSTERKVFMIYIASGEVHLLSSEDGSTPILKLTAGSCVGAMVLIHPYKSNSNFRTGSNCEIYELQTKDFCDLARYFPKEYRLCCNYVQTKIDQAFVLKTIKQEVEPRSVEKTMIWSKRELHRLLSLTAENPGDHKITNIYLQQYFEKDNLNDLIFTKMNLNSLCIKSRDTQYNDLVFIKSSCLWVFHPDSPLLQLTWKFVFCVSIATFLIIAYTNVVGPMISLTLIHCLCILLMIIEIILLCMTPVRLNTSRNMWVVFISRCKDVTFLLDLISIVLSIASVRGLYVQLNKISIVHLRLWRVWAVYDHIETNVVNRLMFKQVICWVGVCGLLWFNAGIAFKKYLGYEYILSHSALLTAPEQSFKEPNFYYFHMLPKHILSCIISAVIASSFHLFRTDSIHITNALNITNKFMHSAPVRKRNISLTWRLHSFLALFINDYNYLQMKHHEKRFFQFPNYMQHLIKPENLLDYINQSQFFEKFPRDLVKELAACSNVETFYENALILTRGVVSKNFNILITGQVCSVELSRVQKVSRGQDLNCLEVMLGLPTARNYVAFSNAVIVSIPYVKFIELLALFPTTNVTFQKTLNNYRAELSNSLTSIIYGKPVVVIEVSRNPEVDSFFPFKCVMYRDSYDAYDYFPPFDNLGFFSFVRFFLLRLTFHPEGKYLLIWEKFRIACLCTGIIIYLIPSYIQRQIEFYALVFDLIGFFDIYLRFHVCYYNKDGILVKHPLYTAKHYFYGSFLIDLISVLPLQFYSDFTIFRSLIRALRMIQLYRLVGFRKYSYSKNYLLSILDVIYLKTIIVVSMSTLVFELHCKESTIYNLKCPLLNGTNAATYYLTLIYMTTSDLTGIGAQNIKTWSILKEDYIEAIFCVVLSMSIFWRAFCLGRTFNAYSSNQLFSNRTSTEFCKLMRFMKSHHMTNTLQRHVADYLDLHWNWVEQINIDSVLYHMDVSLKRDLLFHVFGDPFIRFNSFTSDYRNLINFYKNLFLETKCKVCPTHGKIISMYDVDSMVYFVYRGVIDIAGTDKQNITTLLPGSIFGNLLERHETRQSITATARCNTQFLCIKSAQLYDILKFFPKVQNNFIKSAKKNQCFIKSKAKTFAKFEHLSVRQEIKLRIFNYATFIHLSTVCYFGTLLNLYQIATGETHIYFLGYLYVNDFIHLLAVVIKYLTPVRNELGYWCISIKDIYSVNGRKLFVVIDFLTVLPIDLVIFFSGIDAESNLMYSWLRTNRILRVFYIVREYNFLGTSYLKDLWMIFRKAAIIWYEVVFFAFFATMFFILLDMHLADDHIFSTQKRRDLDMAEIKFLRTLPPRKKLKIFMMYFRFVSETIVLEQSAYNETQSVIRHVVFSVFIFMCFSLQLIVVCHFYGVVYDLYSRNAFVGAIMFHNMLEKTKSYTNHIKNRVLQNARFVYGRDKNHSIRALKTPSTPIYLLELVLNTSFGSYLTRHPIFKHCHPDFLRQVGRGFKLVDLPKGYEVIHKYDTRKCMFFLLHGCIVVLEEDDDIIENYLYLLQPEDCFCFLLGLNHEKQARNTYTCRIQSTILELEYESWEKLVSHFPATGEMLQTKAERMKDQPFLRLPPSRKSSKKKRKN